MEVCEFDWDSSRKGASQLSRTKTIRLSTLKTTTGEILIFALTSPLSYAHISRGNITFDVRRGVMPREAVVCCCRPVTVAGSGTVLPAVIPLRCMGNSMLWLFASSTTASVRTALVGMARDVSKPMGLPTCTSAKMHACTRTQTHMHIRIQTHAQNAEKDYGYRGAKTDAIGSTSNCTNSENYPARALEQYNSKIWVETDGESTDIHFMITRAQGTEPAVRYRNGKLSSSEPTQQ